MDAGNRTLRRVRRQRLDDLSLTQPAALNIVVVHYHGVVELVVDIYTLTTGMEGHEPWTSARPCGGVRVRAQPTRRWVERVHQQGIHPQVGYDHEALVWREGRRMGVWSLLTLGVRSATMVLNQVGHLPQRTLWQNRQHTHGARAIVGDQQPLPSRVDIKMARPVAATHLVVDRLDTPRLTCAVQCPDRTGRPVLLLARLAHPVQPAPGRG